MIKSGALMRLLPLSQEAAASLLLKILYNRTASL